MSDCEKRGSSAQPGGSRSCDTAAPDAQEQVHALLLNTHLLKLRGELDTAVDSCIRALRIDPESVEAHSMLGDIYREQGKYEDAIRWYTLALDLNPESAVDRARLEELKAISEGVGREKLFGWLSDRKIIASLLAVIVGLVLVIIWPFIAPIPEDDPAVMPVTRLPYLAAKRKRTNPSKIVPRVIASERELRLLDALNSSSPLTGRNLRTVGVCIDPRHNSAIITFIGPSMDSGNQAESLVQNGLITLREAVARDAQLNSLTIRALYSLRDGGSVHSEIVFIGSSSREKLAQADPTAISYEQQVMAFDDIWWNPSLKPATQ